MCSAHAEKDEQDKSRDPAAGVAIMLSPRMADKVLDEGHVGTRIAWVHRWVLQKLPGGVTWGMCLNDFQVNRLR